MKFRTEYSPSRSALCLDPALPVVLLGSCFTDNIGSRMADSLMPVVKNPCGTLFNPQSIAAVVAHALDATIPPLEQIGEWWGSYLFPGEFLRPSEEEALEAITAALTELRTALASSQALILSFGTSIVYSRSGQIVGNCHKQPASTFSRTMLAPQEIATTWTALASRLKQFNPALKFIFTVSPVRHVKEGMHQNALSKSALLLATEAIVSEIGSDAEYFAAYEILTDDLRSYRFYGPDLVHPSEEAISYIWEIFCREHFSEAGRAVIARGEEIGRRLRHKSLHPGSEADLRFRLETERLLSAFLSSRPSHLPLLPNQGGMTKPPH